MNKEELIKALKYTEKKHRNDAINTFDTDISMMCSDALKVLKNCIEIPDGATNGDVIQALFDGTILMTNSMGVGYRLNPPKEGRYMPWFDNDWWNTPYKGGRE